MICDHPQRGVDCAVDAIGHAGERGRALNDRLVQIGVVDRASALHHHRQSLETHAGVDVLFRQRFAGSVRRLKELHKDVVPDFEIPGSVAGSGSRVSMLFAEIEVNLGVWPVWSGVADRAPPVVRELADSLDRHSDLVTPDRIGVGVVGMDGWIEPFGRQPHHAGQEIPRPGQRLLLEVVADREIAEHEEERAVALVANLVDIDRAETLLH